MHIGKENHGTIYETSRIRPLLQPDPASDFQGVQTRQAIKLRGRPGRKD